MEIVKGCLYKDIKSDLIVMAYKKTSKDCFSGQVIVGNEKCLVGDYRIDWWINRFKPYSAEIIVKEVIDFNKVQFIEMGSGEVLLTDGCHTNSSFSATRIVDAYYVRDWSKKSAKKVLTVKFE